MCHVFLRPFVRLSLALSLVSLSFVALPAPAQNDTCGGADPCKCGDQVVASRTLIQGVDPVTTEVCTGTALFFFSADEGPPLTLDLGGTTIRGSGEGTDLEFGIEINKSSQVTVRNGTITGFDYGIFGNGAELTHVSNVQVIGNKINGIEFQVFGSNVIERCIVRNNGGDGIVIDGNENTVQLCRAEDNGGRGLVVHCCTGNVVARNVVLRNADDGVVIVGASARLDRNQSKYNGGEGFKVGGTAHLLTLNTAVSNRLDGFTVSAGDSRFERNVSNYNGRPASGFGIADSTSGEGTGGTDNTYVNNLCSGNGLGDASPSGLCQ